jgi:hypothetical protein
MPVDNLCFPQTYYTYAGTIAGGLLKTLAAAFPGDRIFANTVNACLEGGPEEKAVASINIARALRRLLVGADVDRSVVLACKSVKACVHADPVTASVMTAKYAASASADPEAARREHQEILRGLLEAE